MQLHPDESGDAIKRTIESLAAGYIGLDFGAANVGDLRRTQRSELPQGQKGYRAFADEMKRGDRVLIIVHNFPFALATVAGGYNYIRSRPERELGVWFRHFRAVVDVRYYGDLIRDVRKWQRLTMNDTICPLRDPRRASYRLIEYWLGSA